MIDPLGLSLFDDESDELVIPFDEAGEARFPRRANDLEETDDPRGLIDDDPSP